MLKYEKFKQTIMQIIQSSGLDVGIVYFILKDIVKEVEQLYFTQVQKEASAQPKEENDMHEE